MDRVIGRQGQRQLNTLHGAPGESLDRSASTPFAVPNVGVDFVVPPWLLRQFAVNDPIVRRQSRLIDRLALQHMFGGGIFLGAVDPELPRILNSGDNLYEGMITILRLRALRLTAGIARELREAWATKTDPHQDQAAPVLVELQDDQGTRCRNVREQLAARLKVMYPLSLVLADGFRNYAETVSNNFCLAAQLMPTQEGGQARQEEHGEAQPPAPSVFRNWIVQHIVLRCSFLRPSS